MKRKPPVVFTPEGLAKKLQEQVLLEKQREEAVRELNEARELGDRSENGYYKAARWKLSGIDSRLRRLRDVIGRAQVQEHRNTGVVEIGAQVELEIAGKTHHYRMVGPEESSIDEGKLSIFSPVGKAIANRKAGETCTAQTPGGALTVRIVSVE
ncbi:MAG: GreA/GreB family elongation factor [Patescibacteria group bacterium]|nr:GreA/GreB family elongation factor [Patescibacteria group bacterium]